MCYALTVLWHHLLRPHLRPLLPLTYPLTYPLTSFDWVRWPTPPAPPRSSSVVVNRTSKAWQSPNSSWVLMIPPLSTRCDDNIILVSQSSLTLKSLFFPSILASSSSLCTLAHFLSSSFSFVCCPFVLLPVWGIVERANGWSGLRSLSCSTMYTTGKHNHHNHAQWPLPMTTTTTTTINNDLNHNQITYFCYCLLSVTHCRTHPRIISCLPTQPIDNIHFRLSLTWLYHHFRCNRTAILSLWRSVTTLRPTRHMWLSTRYR